MSYWVLVRGPLGVGKSTVARRLSRAIGGRTWSIDAILEHERLEVWEEDRISLQSFRDANTTVVAEASAHLARGTPAIVEGNFYWKEAIDDLIRRLPAPHYAFTLTAPLTVCVERDGRRPPTPPSRSPRAGDRLGPEAVAAVYRLVGAVPFGTPIDAAGSVESVVKAIRTALPSEAPARPGGPGRTESRGPGSG